MTQNNDDRATWTKEQIDVVRKVVSHTFLYGTLSYKIINAGLKALQPQAEKETE